jgi:hypothetical protein
MPPLLATSKTVSNCSHHQVYFERGRLTCVQCGEDRTPLPNVRTVLVEADYREKILNDIEKIIEGLPEDVLKDIEQHAEYLKWKRKNR